MSDTNPRVYSVSDTDPRTPMPGHQSPLVINVVFGFGFGCLTSIPEAEKPAGRITGVIGIKSATNPKLPVIFSPVSQLGLGQGVGQRSSLNRVSTITPRRRQHPNDFGASRFVSNISRDLAKCVSGFSRRSCVKECGDRVDRTAPRSEM